MARPPLRVERGLADLPKLEQLPQITSLNMRIEVRRVMEHLGLLPDRPIKLVAQGVLAGLARVELAELDQAAHRGVVGGELAQPARLEQVGPAVADVGQVEPLADQQHRGAGGAHVGAE